MKFLRVGIIFISCFLVLLLLFIMQPINRGISDEVSKELIKGQNILKAYEYKDIKSIEKEIDTTKEKIESQKAEKERLETLPMYLRYRSTVILGDSMAEALKDYGVLDSNVVLAIRGRRTDNCDQEIKETISLSPKHIFMTYGSNDIQYYRKNTQSFIAAYEKQIKKLKKALPDAKIYINSILPCADYVYREKPIFKMDATYNKELKKMCRRLNVIYINNDELMKWKTSSYESDGIHPKYPFYPLWLSRMATIAGI